MKVSVQFQRKVRGEEEFSSNAFHVGIESEPPREVAEDREKLRAYVEELFKECCARVDDQVGRSRPTRIERPPQPQRSTTRRPPGAASRPAPVEATRNGQGDGLASPKQVNFVRSLAERAGYSAGQVGALAEEVLGVPVRDLRALTKKQASALIDQLQASAA